MLPFLWRSMREYRCPFYRQVKPPFGPKGNCHTFVAELSTTLVENKLVVADILSRSESNRIHGYDGNDGTSFCVCMFAMETRPRDRWIAGASCGEVEMVSLCIHFILLHLHGSRSCYIKMKDYVLRFWDWFSRCYIEGGNYNLVEFVLVMRTRYY